MRDQIDRKSFEEGRNESRLPYFTPEESERILGSNFWNILEDFCLIFVIFFILGTWDFFGLNHYTTQYILDFPNNISRGVNYYLDQDMLPRRDPDWPT